jgi:hypothetical protein
MLAYARAQALCEAKTKLPMARPVPLNARSREKAAVLDGNSRALCRQLNARGIPYLLYTGRPQIGDECAAAPIVRKPVSPTHVVESVERLLMELNGHRLQDVVVRGRMPDR